MGSARAVAGIAAALVLLAGCAQESEDPPTPAQRRPAPQPHPSSAPTPGARPLVDLPRGHAPRIGYVAHATWRGPDGSRVDLRDRYGISSVTPYAAGFLVTDTRWFEGSLGLAGLDPEGRLEEEWTSAGGAARSRGRVAWTSFVPLESGEVGVPALLHRAGTDGTVTTQPWDGPVPFYVAGFSGDRVVAGGSFVGPVRAIAPDGRRTRVPHLVVARATSGSLVAGSLDTDGSRSGVVDLDTGRLLWRTRGSVASFSPSGRRVVVSDGRRAWWVARASDGARLWDLEVPERTVAGEPAWERERRLLAVATRRKEIAILRFARGDVERATPVAPHRSDRPAYVLATQP